MDTNGTRATASESDLRDPWVGALAVDAVVLQPLVLGVGAVLLEGAAVLSFTPDAPEQRVCFQTQTAASTLGVALVKMDWRKETEKEKKERRTTVKQMMRELQRQLNLFWPPKLTGGDFKTHNKLIFWLFTQTSSLSSV